MNIKYYTFLLTLMVTFTWGTGGCLTYAAEKKGTAEHYITLENGMNVILKPNHTVPMFASTVVVHAGVMYETRDMNGVSHMLEHMLFNGTEELTQEELYDAVDMIGAYNNAFTRNEYTGFLFVVPSEHMVEAMKLQYDMVCNSVIPPEKLEKEKGIVIEEIGKSMQRPTTGVDHFFRHVLFKGTSLASPILGSVQTVSNFTRDTVYDYYRARYTPDKMTVLCMGDFVTDQVVDQIKQTYGGVPAGVPIPAPDTRIKWPVKPLIHEKQLDGRTTYLMLGFPAPAPESDDFEAFLLLARLLDSGYASGLKTRLNAGDGPPQVFSVSVSYEFSRHHPYLEIMAMLPERSDYIAVAKNITGIIDDFGFHGTDREEIARSFIQMETEEYSLQEKLYLYGIMKAPYLIHVSPDWFLNTGEHLGTVTPGQLKKVARTYLVGKPFLGAALGPACSDGVREEIEPEPGTPATEGRLQTRELAHEKRVENRRLGNGLRLVVEENPENRLFAIHVLVRNRAIHEPPGKEGIADFLHRLLEKGSSGMSGSDLSEKLASMGADLQVTDNPFIPFDDYYFTGEYSYIRLETTAPFAMDTLELLGNLMQDPGFSEEDIEVVRQEMLNVIRMREDQPAAIARRLFGETLLDNSPLANPVRGTRESVREITMEDLQAFHQQYFAPENLIISIIGSLPAGDIIAKLDDTFGTMHTITPEKMHYLPYPGPVQRTVENEKTVGKEQSGIIIGALVSFDASEIPALTAMNAVLSKRLAFNLREKQGLAYSIGSSFHVASGGPSPWGWITASMGTRPENIEKAVKGILEEMKNMRSDKPDEMELKKTINSFIGKSLRQQMTSIGRAYRLGLNAHFGWETGHEMQLLEAMKKLEPDDIKKIARKHLHPANMVIAVAK